MQHTNPTQNQLILDYIAEFGNITPLEAMRDLGVMRLASRISDLKRKGYKIKTEKVAVTNRFGKKTNIARYSIEIKSPVNYEMPYSAGMSGTVKRGCG